MKVKLSKDYRVAFVKAAIVISGCEQFCAAVKQNLADKSAASKFEALEKLVQKQSVDMKPSR